MNYVVGHRHSAKATSQLVDPCANLRARLSQTRHTTFCYHGTGYLENLKSLSRSLELFESGIPAWPILDSLTEPTQLLHNLGSLFALGRKILAILIKLGGDGLHRLGHTCKTFTVGCPLLFPQPLQSAFVSVVNLELVSFWWTIAWTSITYHWRKAMDSTSQ